MTLAELFKAIADVIREKTNSQDFIKPIQFPEKIQNITGGEVPEGTLEITNNGLVTLDKYYEKINVAVPGPSGEITVTENGNGIDITQYASLNVNVQNSEPYWEIIGDTIIVHNYDVVNGNILSADDGKPLGILYDKYGKREDYKIIFDNCNQLGDSLDKFSNFVINNNSMKFVNYYGDIRYNLLLCKPSKELFKSFLGYFSTVYPNYVPEGMFYQCYLPEKINKEEFPYDYNFLYNDFHKKAFELAGYEQQAFDLMLWERDINKKVGAYCFLNSGIKNIEISGDFTCNIEEDTEHYYHLTDEDDEASDFYFNFSVGEEYFNNNSYKGHQFISPVLENIKIKTKTFPAYCVEVWEDYSFKSLYLSETETIEPFAILINDPYGKLTSKIYIYIPKTIKKIYNNAFSYIGLSDEGFEDYSIKIYYEGTEEEWNAIERTENVFIVDDEEGPIEVSDPILNSPNIDITFLNGNGYSPKEWDELLESL